MVISPSVHCYERPGYGWISPPLSSDPANCAERSQDGRMLRSLDDGSGDPNKGGRTGGLMTRVYDGRYAPRTTIGGVRASAIVVIRQPAVQIRCQASVVARWMGDALQNVDDALGLIHVIGPVQTSVAISLEGFLLVVGDAASLYRSFLDHRRSHMS